VKFCEWLSAKDKRNVSAPHGAEWEYACRAGGTTRFRLRRGRARADRECQRCGREFAGHRCRQQWIGLSQTMGQRSPPPVGRLKPNGWGLHDMSGNAEEWCSDWAADNPRRGQRSQGPESAPTKVIRGGSWAYSATDLRVARVWECRPTAATVSTGFRLVTGPLECSSLANARWEAYNS